MSRSVGWRLVAAGAAICALGFATACTAAPSGQSASPSTPPSAPASSTAAPGSPSATASGLTIDIMIADGKVTPNGEKIDVAQGTTVTLNVTSDQDDEVHAHTGGDGYELEVKAGEPATGSFVASDVGSFEIESHHLEKIIAILNVR